MTRPGVAGFCLVLIAGTAPAAPLSVDIGPTRVEAPVRSFKDLRDRNVVKQAFDFSCGAAAFATLLTHALNDPVTEVEVLEKVIEQLTKEEEANLKGKGLSLLDLQKLAREKGYKAQGFRIAADQLPKLTRPAIVYIRPRGYEHFAVLRGVRGDRVHLADPSQGNWAMPLYRFFDMWADEQGRGVVFLVERQDGRWDPAYGLELPEAPGPRPELLSTREMIEFPLNVPPPLRPQVPQ